MSRTLLVLSVVVAFAACGGDPDFAPAAGGIGQSPPSVPTAPSTGDVAPPDAGPDASEPAGPALCEGLEQRSQDVEELAFRGTAPPPLGGTIAPGTYVLNELVAYGAPDDGSSDPPPPAPTGTVSRSTMIVSARSIRILDATGTMTDGLPKDEPRASSYVVQGTTLKLDSECGPPNALAEVPFSANPTRLTLYLGADRLATFRLDRLGP